MGTGEHNNLWVDGPLLDPGPHEPLDSDNSTE